MQQKRISKQQHNIQCVIGRDFSALLSNIKINTNPDDTIFKEQTSVGWLQIRHTITFHTQKTQYSQKYTTFLQIFGLEITNT